MLITIVNPFSIWWYCGVIRSIFGFMKFRNQVSFTEAQYLNVNAARVFWAGLRKGHIIGSFVFFLALCSAYLIGSHSAVCHALLYIAAFDFKASGRMQGNVLMRNGRGRAFVNPALVRNSHTISARALLAQYSSGYAGLTAAQQLAWSQFHMTVSNRLGQSGTIKGKTCYVRLNVNLSLVGGAPIPNPPILGGVATPITSASAAPVAATGLIPIVYAPSPTAATTDHLLFATKPLGTQINKPAASAYRFIAVMPNSTASPFAAGASYTSRFGAITGKAGQVIFFSLTAINNLTGQSVAAVGIKSIIV